MTGESKKRYLREEYVARINRVIDYIESHIDDELRLETLARVACFSSYHFHRIFSAMMGEPLGQFIQRIRLERAANQLLGNPKKSITEIALDSGFSGSATFARAFKETFGMSASEWRDGGYFAWSKIGKPNGKGGKPLGKDGKEDGRPDGYAGFINSENRRAEMKEKPKTSMKIDVEVADLPEYHVAYARHVGPYQGDPAVFEALFGKLMGWAGPRGLCRFPETKVMCVYHDNPDVTPDDKLRVSACITVPEDTSVEGEIGEMDVPGGRFAVAHLEITDPKQYGEAWDSLMGNWMPDSGYQPDDRLCYELYLNDAKSDPEGKQIVELCVPVKPL
jgi:AraC family transcriptional regulator